MCAPSLWLSDYWDNGPQGIRISWNLRLRKAKPAVRECVSRKEISQLLQLVGRVELRLWWASDGQGHTLATVTELHLAVGLYVNWTPCWDPKMYLWGARLSLVLCSSSQCDYVGQTFFVCPNWLSKDGRASLQQPYEEPERRIRQDSQLSGKLGHVDSCV